MKINVKISNVSNPVEITLASGEKVMKRILFLSKTTHLDNGNVFEDTFMADYFGDTPQEELLQLAADSVEVTATIVFKVRFFELEDGSKKPFQNITLRGLARAI